MPTLAASHVTPYKIKVDGADIDPGLQVTEIKVRQSLRQPSSAMIKITDPKLEHMDSHNLQIGSRLQVLFGSTDAQTPTKVFDGEIVALEPEFDQKGVSIGVRAYDKSHRLYRAKKVRMFQRMSAKNMVDKVMSEAGIQGSSDSTTRQFEFFQQSDETDREFIRRLERLHDFELVIEDDRFKFRQAGQIGAPVASLEYGVSLLNFRPRLTAAQQDAEVEVRGWDVKGKQTISMTERSADGSAQIGVARSTLTNKFGSNKLLVSDRSVVDTGEASQLAKSTLQRRAAAFLEAEGSCLGNPAVKAGATVEIKGVGTKFSGKYLITSVVHSMRSTGTYKTSFVISGRSDRSLLDLMHPPPARPWGQSLVIGVVTNNNDPDKIGRIRVKYPALSDDQEGDWARVSTHNAGDQRGIYMLPQVGDEVVVAFENADPRRPLVIGSLFNGKEKPSSVMLPDQKGGLAILSKDRAYVQTAEDMTFKSDKKMIIEIGTDQTGKASGKVEMKSGTTYTLEAGSEMKIKGVSVTVEASGALKLKGATVEIESQGPAKLSGAMVDINASGIANLKGSMVNIG